jgi:signal transduction histidine kinase/ActR/RegA family two-component response regulator
MSTSFEHDRTSNIDEEREARRVAEEEVRRHQAITKLVADSTLEYLVTKDTRRINEIIVEGTVRLMNAEFGALFQCDEQGGLSLRCVSAMAWSSAKSLESFESIRSQVKREGTVPLAMDANLLTKALKHTEALVTNDASQHPAWAGSLPEGHPEIRSFMGVPLRVDGKTVGLLALANREGGFKDDDRVGVEALVQCLAMAISVSIADRKEQLAAERLRQAQRLDSIGRLAGGVAHDFNNILSPILGFSQLLLEDLAPDSGTREFAEEISVAAKRAKTLVARLLTFSKGGMKLSRPTDARPALEEAMQLMRSSLPTMVKLDYEDQWSAATDAAAIVAVDPLEIQQIIVNLCTNSAMAMPSSGGRVSVRLAHVDNGDPAFGNRLTLAPGRYLKLSVSDTGSGIESRFIRRIFEPFFTTGEVGKSSGLGLSVVHGIVNKAEGEILLDTEFGQGTTISIYLPHCAEEEESTAEGEAIPRGVERILVVDDEESVARITGRILERLGYHVEYQLHSRGALEMIREDPSCYDLILTDQGMPDMTGTALAESALLVNPKLPIILMTGYSENVDRGDAEEIGIVDYLLKPVEKGDLSRAVRAALDRPNFGRAVT